MADSRRSSLYSIGSGDGQQWPMPTAEGMEQMRGPGSVGSNNSGSNSSRTGRQQQQRQQPHGQDDTSTISGDNHTVGTLNTFSYIGAIDATDNRSYRSAGTGGTGTGIGTGTVPTTDDDTTRYEREQRMRRATAEREELIDVPITDGSTHPRAMSDLASLELAEPTSAIVEGRSSISIETPTSLLSGGGGGGGAPPPNSSSSLSPDNTTRENNNNRPPSPCNSVMSADPALKSALNVSSLPAYNLQPAAIEKSDRIMRSYPSSPQPPSSYFGGGNLLAWRRGWSGAAASEGGGGAAGSGAGAATSTESNNSRFRVQLSSVEEHQHHHSAGGHVMCDSDFSVHTVDRSVHTVDRSVHTVDKAVTEVTSVTDNGDDDDDESDENNHRSYSLPSRVGSHSLGSLLKDTYSFIYIYPACCSAPFVYALTLFSFQSLVYGLLLSSLIDTSHPQNPLHVPAPASVSVQMRIAQACAILIAVFNSVDVMVAMNNLLRAPDAIVVMKSEENTEPMTNEPDDNNNTTLSSSSDRASTQKSPDIDVSSGGRITIGRRSFTTLSRSSELASIQQGIAHERSDISSGRTARRSFPVGFRFRFANVLRLIEGCLAVAASFILVVRSDDIIEMFINFAALEFVVNLDNLAFALAEHGLISDRLQDAARFISGLGFKYRDDIAHSTNHRTRKARSKEGGASCIDATGRVAHLKGTYLSRLLGSPVRFVKRRPDSTRRFTLFLMTLTLFGWWGYILWALDSGEYLCKSLDVEFFHAHAMATSEEEAELGVKPFLATRSGMYVRIPLEDNSDVLDRIWKTIRGKHLFVAYRRIDLKPVKPQDHAVTYDVAVNNARIPSDYEEVVFFDPTVQEWIFASCDPNTDLRREDRLCIGPQVHSTATGVMDLTALTKGAFHIVNEENPDATLMTLPATITCNECGRQVDPSLRSAATTVQTCGGYGGQCSLPQEDLGFSRLCDCPGGSYGMFCADHYGTSCPTLELHYLEGQDEPKGAAHFEKMIDEEAVEGVPFTLLKKERGVGNTPVWQHRHKSAGFIDRIEWRGGTHWTITRRLEMPDLPGLETLNDIVFTLAIAEGTAPDPMGTGIGSTSAGLAGLGGMNAQPAPAGFQFYKPVSAAWGVQPDHLQPFSSYKFQCKPLGATMGNENVNVQNVVPSQLNNMNIVQSP
eukprot:CAMPEP_0183707998 /NCGR_PEP_ID=MMETSP0737-20130205/4401_1 /TAXON_ID=385413 /ORGANISM="Thalassiosira miniscula, Strain CCMP1093" /LENGTH=1166 /DNA_ID=CAMNT_0025935773 /DNA_START=69 /DNA_END=3569 /DNA_ORIENTATION=+